MTAGIGENSMVHEYAMLQRHRIILLIRFFTYSCIYRDPLSDPARVLVRAQ